MAEQNQNPVSFVVQITTGYRAASGENVLTLAKVADGNVLMTIVTPQGESAITLTTEAANVLRRDLAKATK